MALLLKPIFLVSAHSPKCMLYLPCNKAKMVQGDQGREEHKLPGHVMDASYSLCWWGTCISSTLAGHVERWPTVSASLRGSSTFLTTLQDWQQSQSLTLKFRCQRFYQGWDKEVPDVASLLTLSQGVTRLGGMEKMASCPPPGRPGEVIWSKRRRCGVLL